MGDGLHDGCRWMDSLMARAMTVGVLMVPVPTPSLDGPISAASELLLLPGRETERRQMILTCEQMTLMSCMAILCGFALARSLIALPCCLSACAENAVFVSPHRLRTPLGISAYSCLSA